MSPEEAPTPPGGQIPVTIEGPRRRGRPAGMKSLPKHPPRPISEIWRAATEEERAAARTAGEELLAYWRGLAGSKAVAEALGLRQNRVYQMQKKALAGMVAGLLPPRTKKDESLPVGPDPAKEAAELRKEVARLRKEREALLGLVRLLRSLPGIGEGAKERKNAGPKGEEETRRKTGKEPSRRTPSRRSEERRGAEGVGEGPRNHGEDASKLGGRG